MGTCKYCLQDAGLFSHVHKDCEEKHNQGVTALEDGIRRYFKDVLKVNDLTELVTKLKSENFSSDGLRSGYQVYGQGSGDQVCVYIIGYRG